VAGALVERPLRVDAGDLRLKLGGAHVDEVLSLGHGLPQPRVHLGLFGESAIGQHRLVLDLLLFGQLLKRVGIVVLADQDVGELDAVLAEARGQLRAQVAGVDEPPVAVELLGPQLAEVLLDQRIGEADDHVVLVRAPEPEFRHHLERVGDAVHHRDVDRDRIAVHGGDVDRAHRAMVGTALGLVVRELDDLDVTRERADRLVAADLAAVTGSDQRFLQALVRPERDLAQADLAGSHVRDDAAAQEEQGRKDEQELEREGQKASAAKLERRHLHREPRLEPAGRHR
jgi:hypothetical protein